LDKDFDKLFVAFNRDANIHDSDDPIYDRFCAEDWENIDGVVLDAVTKIIKENYINKFVHYIDELHHQKNKIFNYFAEQLTNDDFIDLFGETFIKKF
jgi:hypothetical protein